MNHQHKSILGKFKNLLPHYRVKISLDFPYFFLFFATTLTEPVSTKNEIKLMKKIRTYFVLYSWDRVSEMLAKYNDLSQMLQSLIRRLRYRRVFESLNTRDYLMLLIFEFCYTRNAFCTIRYDSNIYQPNLLVGEK